MAATPGTWTSPDGWRIIRHLHRPDVDNYVVWRVYAPAATRHCGETCTLRAAKAALDSLRAAR